MAKQLCIYGKELVPLREVGKDVGGGCVMKDEL